MNVSCKCRGNRYNSKISIVLDWTGLKKCIAHFVFCKTCVYLNGNYGNWSKIFNHKKNCIISNIELEFSLIWNYIPIETIFKLCLCAFYLRKINLCLKTLMHTWKMVDHFIIKTAGSKLSCIYLYVTISMLILMGTIIFQTGYFHCKPKWNPQNSVLNTHVLCFWGILKYNLAPVLGFWGILKLAHVLGFWGIL